MCTRPRVATPALRPPRGRWSVAVHGRGLGLLVAMLGSIARYEHCRLRRKREWSRARIRCRLGRRSRHPAARDRLPPRSCTCGKQQSPRHYGHPQGVQALIRPLDSAAGARFGRLLWPTAPHGAQRSSGEPSSGRRRDRWTCDPRISTRLARNPRSLGPYRSCSSGSASGLQDVGGRNPDYGGVSGGHRL
jgi:hypothetical protein